MEPAKEKPQVSSELFVEDVNFAFELFDACLPHEQTWNDEEAIPVHIISNNPMVDGKNYDEKFALFDPRFSYLFGSPPGIALPAVVELCKYKVTVFDGMKQVTSQFRRHLVFADLSRQGSQNWNVFVLHEPELDSNDSHRRLEYGILRSNLDEELGIIGFEFRRMCLAFEPRRIQRMVEILATCKAVASGEELQHRPQTLSEVERLIRRAQILNRLNVASPLTARVLD